MPRRQRAKEKPVTAREIQAQWERVLHMQPGELDRDRCELRARIQQARTIRHMDEFWRRESEK